MKKNKKETKPTDVLINFVLDRSSSMMWVAQETIDGFNSFLKDQQNQPGKAYLSLTLFSDYPEVRYVADDITEVPFMSANGENSYIADGWTALRDAVGVTITGTEQWVKNHPEFDGQVITVIFTDGGENQSRSWDLPRLNALIERKQKEGWAFQFLGSGGSAWLEGKSFTTITGQSVANVVYDSHTAPALYGSISSSINHTRSTGAAYSFANADSALLSQTLSNSTEEEKAKFAKKS